MAIPRSSCAPEATAGVDWLRSGRFARRVAIDGRPNRAPSPARISRFIVSGVNDRT